MDLSFASNVFAYILQNNLLVVEKDRHSPRLKLYLLFQKIWQGPGLKMNISVLRFG